MIKQDSFTFIIAVKDPDESILSTIDSVQNLSLDNYEIIIQCCSDKANMFKEDFNLKKKQVNSKTRFFFEKDLGIYNALNKGIKKATKNWIMILGSGDLIISKNIFKCPDLNNLQYDVIYGHTIFVKNDKIFIDQINQKISWYKGMYFCHQSCLTRAEILKNTGFNEEYKIAADYDFYIQISKEKFKYVPTIVTQFIMDGVSSLNFKRTIQEKLIIRKRKFFNNRFLALLDSVLWNFYIIIKR